MPKLSTGLATLLMAGLVLSLTACDSADPVEDETLLDQVIAATAQFADTQAALDAGYQPDEHCVAHPELGGMGYHWVNEALVDPVFDPLQPEALLYAPDGDGYRLVGLEYIVIDVGQDRPHFDDHPFDIGGVPPLMAAGVDHWSLHVWAFEENPSGLFAPFNPNVSCE